jgi:hypothetical protein
LLRRDEDPRLAACHEIREEVVITIRPDDLMLITSERNGRLEKHISQYRLSERPRVRIDNGEIVEAPFVDPAVLQDRDPLIRGIAARCAWARAWTPALASRRAP